MYLAITDGTTTVVLSGTAPVRGCTYFPGTPQRTLGELQPVTETAEVNLSGTAAAIRASVNAVELLILAAVQRQATGAGSRVYAMYKPVDGDATTWRSEITDGRVIWSTNPGLRRLGDSNPFVQVAVIWARVPYWEGAEVELPLSANGQAAATGGRTIYNDPANGNWVQVAADQVTGNLPAPIILQMTNTSGSSRNFRRVMVSANAYSDPANLVHYLQGEARLSGGTVTADATCSGGNRLAFTTDISTPTTFQWTLPQADMQRTRGRRFRILARIDYAGALYVQPQVRNSAGVILWEGDELAFDSIGGESWRDFGVLPLPPGSSETAAAAMRLGLSLRGGGLGSLDVLQLSSLDSYRHWELPPTGLAIANNAAIVHDGIAGAAYSLASSVRTPLPTAFGGPILLQPAMLQRLSIVHQIYTGAGGGAGEAPIAATMSVRAWHRPRRVTV